MTDKCEKEKLGKQARKRKSCALSLPFPFSESASSIFLSLAEEKTMDLHWWKIFRKLPTPTLLLVCDTAPT
jgi:hypothetical protein